MPPSLGTADVLNDPQAQDPLRRQARADVAGYSLQQGLAGYEHLLGSRGYRVLVRLPILPLPTNRWPRLSETQCKP